MNTPKHTPGPWHVGKRAYTRAIYGPKGEEVALMLEFFNPDDDNMANARLIAACPKLLSALENLYARAFAQLDKSATHDGIENCKVLGDARAAIQEATAP